MADIKICDRCGGVGNGNAIGAIGCLNQVSNPGPGGLKLHEVCPDCVASFHRWFDSPEGTPRAQLGARPFTEPYRDESTPPTDSTPDQEPCAAGTRHRGLPVRCTLALGHELPAATRIPGVEYSEQHYNSRYGNRW